MIRAAVEQSAISPVDDVDGAVSRRFRFPGDFLGFQGHFPGAPVLPAVVQILMATMLVETALGSALCLSSVENAKFTRAVGADEEILVKCARSNGETPAYRVQVYAEATLASSFGITFDHA